MAIAASLPAALPAPVAQADDPALRIVGNRTQPVFSRADAVLQQVDIETATDSDGDGRRDTVRMRILRPKETDAGLKVATIIEASPYWAGGNDVPNHGVDLDEDGLPVAAVLRPHRNRPALTGPSVPWGGYYDNCETPGVPSGAGA
ncbi:hypothetical protein AB0D12_35575 [Streptomyces sp. NPDC048479]|uniref:hypothetical protein n=1 Tax=Streptomyces sp. NPDC048479 TaxID=3154725 RepID=UPI00343D5E0C